MAQATSISLSKFSETVQASVKAAVLKHPKFKGDQPTQVAISYLIRGIPVPDGIAGNVTVRETQAFATDLATQIAGSQPGIAVEAGGTVEGAIFSQGRHLIIGIPVTPNLLIEK
jgi:hypothetical protein